MFLNLELGTTEKKVWIYVWKAKPIVQRKYSKRKKRKENQQDVIPYYTIDHMMALFDKRPTAAPAGYYWLMWSGGERERDRENLQELGPLNPDGGWQPNIRVFHLSSTREAGRRKETVGYNKYTRLQHKCFWLFSELTNQPNQPINQLTNSYIRDRRPEIGRRMAPGLHFRWTRRLFVDKHTGNKSPRRGLIGKSSTARLAVADMYLF